MDARPARPLAALARAALAVVAAGCLAADPAVGAAGEPAPAAAAAATADAGGDEEAAAMTVLAASDGPHDLAGQETRVVLEPVAGGSPAALLAALGDEGDGGRLHLVLRDLATDEPPAGLVHLYLDLAPGEEPADDDPRHVGSLNFFGVETGGATADRRAYEVTAQRGRLAEAVRRGRPLTVTFRSASPAAAPPRLGWVELVAG